MEQGHNASGALAQFVRQVEGVEDDIKGLNDDKKEIFASAKQQGFDVPALKAVVARRRKLRDDPDKVAEQDALFDLYWKTVGEAGNG